MFKQLNPAFPVALKETVCCKILTGQEHQSIIIIILPRTNVSQSVVQEAHRAGSDEVTS